MKFSVIIPIYNVEKYLKECVLSINPKKRNDIEIILVNDGSKDNSYQICKELALELPNVKLIDKENSGSMDSWIQGVKMATGEYTYIMDSDDKLGESFFEILDDYANKQYDIIVFDYYQYYQNGIEGMKVNHIPYGELPREVLQEMKNHIGNLLTEYSLYKWDKVIKTEIFQKGIEKIDFRSVYFEDHPISILNLLHANSLYYIDKKLYYYRLRKTSVTHTINQRVFQDNITIENFIIKLAQENNNPPEEMRKIYLYFLYQYTRWSLKSEESPREKKVTWKDIQEIEGKNKKIVLLFYKLKWKKMYQWILEKKQRKENSGQYDIFE